ncbi:MAG: SRPBCC family protein [Pseudomonadota bacterium]
MTFNPETDLSIERQMAAAPDTVWRCWTDPDLFKQWFVPKPVEVSAVEHDFRAGGISRVVMTLPGGKVMDTTGCFLEVETAAKLVWTDALGPGYRPNGSGFMTVTIEFLPKDGGTLYRATVLHADAKGKAQHEGMGFHDGWGTTLRQLDDLSAAL